ncbi:ABC transporter permease subunit [Bradyrhizobium sp. Pear76]|uniref:ABC transporter permease subunit n=1 Tax=Bradyrhizobium oropedii TaxID=1571201 RepID=UPI001E50FC3A|nr:ABC transporter permease subunit [Bradyrhizobium oropedii]MCC8968147.1 ABC transporter permease subunit [Bradyrhizobium oropedii]
MLIIRRLTQQPIVLALPALLILAAVFGAPIVQLFFKSFNLPSFSLVNYQAFFFQPANVRVLYQTVEMSLTATGICLLLGYPTAYLISTARTSVRVVLIVLVVIPYLTSSLARTYAWIVILGDHGLINNFLIDNGFISDPLPLIYNRFAVYLGMVYIMLPVMILPMVSVMVGIDRSLMAAAQSMGASSFTSFWRVFFPLSLPGVRSGCLLVFVLCLGFYITPAALGGLRDTMLSNFIYAEVSTSFNIPRVAASAFILLAVAFAMLWIVGLDLSGSHGLPGQSPKDERGRAAALIGRLLRSLSEYLISHRSKRWKSRRFRPERSGRMPEVAGAMFLASMISFLVIPGIIIVVMSFSDANYFQFPPAALSLRWYYQFFGDPSWDGALLASFQIGVAVTAIATVAGTLAAYGLARAHSTVRAAITMFMLMPITLPAIVVGIATYLGLLNFGLLGSKLGIILAHSIGGVAYAMVIVSATLANFDRRLERAAMSMMAGPFRTFRRISLPLILPGVLGGAVFAFIHSFDEVVITSLVSGLSIRTLPLKMWENIRHQIDPTVAAASSLLIVLAMIWLVAIYAAWWRTTSRTQRIAAEAQN